MDKLEGRVAVITGGASGIGKASGALLARNGMRVVLADIVVVVVVVVVALAVRVAARRAQPVVEQRVLLPFERLGHRLRS